MPTMAEKITAQSGMFSQNQVPITPPLFIGRSAPAPSCQPARAGPPCLNRAGLPSVLALKRLARRNEHMQRYNQRTKSRKNRSGRTDVAALVLVQTVRVFMQMGHAFVRTVRAFARTGPASVRTGPASVRTGPASVRTGPAFADDCCPLRARLLLAPSSPERFPDRRRHLMWNLVDLVPGEVHDLKAGPAQRGVPPQLGNCSLRVRVLDCPIGLADRLVSPPQEVGPANHPGLFGAHPDLEFRRGKPMIAECDPGDRLQYRLR